MKVNIYTGNIFFRQYIFNNDFILEDVIEKLKKIGGKYYLFTTKFNRWIYFYEPEYIYKSFINDYQIPLTLTENIYIFYDDEILKYKYLYEKFLYNKISYEIFYKKLTKFLLRFKD